MVSKAIFTMIGAEASYKANSIRRKTMHSQTLNRFLGSARSMRRLQTGGYAVARIALRIAQRLGRSCVGMRVRPDCIASRCVDALLTRRARRNRFMDEVAAQVWVIVR